MVKYTGRRSSQITKNSTNQLGLKLSGSGGGIGSRFGNVGQQDLNDIAKVLIIKNYQSLKRHQMVSA